MKQNLWYMHCWMRWTYVGGEMNYNMEVLCQTLIKAANGNKPTK